MSKADEAMVSKRGFTPCLSAQHRLSRRARRRRCRPADGRQHVPEGNFPRLAPLGREADEKYCALERSGKRRPFRGVGTARTVREGNPRLFPAVQVGGSGRCKGLTLPSIQIWAPTETGIMLPFGSVQSPLFMVCSWRLTAKCGSALLIVGRISYEWFSLQ